MVEKSSRAHEPAAGVAEWDADSDVSKFGCADESDSPETDRVSFEGCFRGTITLILGVIYLYDADLQCTRYKKMEDIITMQAASADLTDIRCSAPAQCFFESLGAAYLPDPPVYSYIYPHAPFLHPTHPHPEMLHAYYPRYRHLENDAKYPSLC
ncbi:hypothetical protein BDP27DRAFT_1428145 [Rhodocollybia butyracea]|uniref:Uncharacterized protein n=1 Tax=Rhodocollybia butyracea TaxID=206335 RepID=A0A9P5U1C5_9AGAR|nr:hypothetical protein BDP27DRAFT_1428610 [Rhodocollybia butyracea]KAF9062239.1 hypothetical protein BDP27DRAFT_1428145 [Rhodocollybia butyracea]